MPSPNLTTPAPSIKVSEEVQKKYPDLVELIKQSRSMTNEERQYWVDVLLIMTEDQIQNLRNILDNERKQIAEAEKEWNEGQQKEDTKVKIHFDEIKYKEKKRILMEAEQKHETEETHAEATLLEQISKM